jgi:hypothetical protein
MPHWHANNPWADKVVYVPIEDAAACSAGGQVVENSTGKTFERDAAFLVEQWSKVGDKLDAYIIPNNDTSNMHIGVRYGPDDGDYLSPRLLNHELALELVGLHGATSSVPGPR